MFTASSCCDNCGMRPATGQRLLRCSACLSAYYCSQTCQAAAWRTAHKRDCKHMALETLQELMRRSGVGGRLVLPNPDSAVVRRPNPSAASKEVVDRALALSWTLRDEGGYALFHVTVLKGRVQMELDGQCDVESRRRVIRLVNRALTTLEWPSLTESLPNWVTFFELSAQLIALGGRDEGLAIWSRQLEGIEARATPTRAASTLLTFCKLLVEKALDGAEKMDDDDYVRDPNVLSAETKATLARAAALLSAATSEEFETLESLIMKLHACQAKDIGVPFARRHLELSPPGRKVISYFFLADFLRGAYRLREADDAAKEGLAMAHLSPAERLSLLMVRSGIMRTMGRLPEALAIAKAGLSIAQARGLDIVTATLKVADLLDRMGQVEEAKVYDAMLVERGVPVGEIRSIDIAPFLARYGITNFPPDEARRLKVWLANLSQGRNRHIGPFYRFARHCADRWGIYFPMDLRALSLCAEGIEVGNLTEGPDLPRKIQELLVDMLRKKGTPEALREAQVVAAEVARMKEAEEANWRVALEETRAAVAAEALVRWEGEGVGPEQGGGGGGGQGAGGGGKKKKNKKGKKKRGKAGATVNIEKQDASLERAMRALEIEDTSGGDAVAGGAAEVHQEGEEEVQEEELEECSICIEPLAGEGEEDGHVRTLDCGHAFHEHCMDLWFGKCAEKGIEPTCPYCRHPIRG